MRILPKMNSFHAVAEKKVKKVRNKRTEKNGKSKKDNKKYL